MYVRGEPKGIAKAIIRKFRKGPRDMVCKRHESREYDPKPSDLTRGRTKSPSWGMEVR